METYKGMQVPDIGRYKDSMIKKGKLDLPCVHYPIQTGTFCRDISCEDCLFDNTCKDEPDLDYLIEYLISKEYITKEKAMELTLDGRV